MKIVHLLSTNQLAGAERLVLNLATRFKGVERCVVLCKGDGELSKALTDKGIENFKWSRTADIRGHVKPDSTTIIHAHDYRASIIASHLFGDYCKIISHIHHNPNWARRISLRALLYFRYSTKLSKIVYVSEFAKNSFIFSSQVSDKSITLHNFLISDDIRTPASNKLERDIDILFLGRLNKTKRPDLFVKVIRALPNNIKAVIAGDGPMKAKILKVLPNNIRYIGWVDNPRAVLSRTKILLSVSANEGFGLTLLESMENGAIPVAVSTGASEEIITDKVDGFIVNENRKQLAETCLEILKSYDSYRTEISKNMLVKVNSFRIEDYIKRLEELYIEILSSRSKQ